MASGYPSEWNNWACDARLSYELTIEQRKQEHARRLEEFDQNIQNAEDIVERLNEQRLEYINLHNLNKPEEEA